MTSPDRSPTEAAGTDSPPAPDPPHRIGYETVDREYADERLPVEGTIPDWLSGAYLRNGPGKFEAGGDTFEHWFDGLAMLRRFAFEDDGVRYTNRFLRTEAYREAREGRVAAAGFASAPDRGPVERLLSLLSLEPTDNANADVATLGGSTVALTESPRAVAFDPRTLETLGAVEWADDLPVGHTTPHLRRDPASGETWGWLTTFLPRPAYRVFRIPPGTYRRETVATVRVDRPAYMHSFGLTAEYVLLTEQPFDVHPLALFAPGDDPFFRRYEWRPQRRTRFLVLDRTTGETVAQHRVAPFFTFHHANAFEDVRENSREVVVDLVAWENPAVLNGMTLDRLRSSSTAGGGGELRRYRIPLDGGDPTAHTIATDLALPRVDDRYTGRRHRFVYAQHTAGEGPPRAVARVDTETGSVATWRGEGYVGEPVFVPAPGSDPPADATAGGDPASGEGVVVFETLSPDSRRSALVVLDAASMAERGRALAPHHLPFGFHGQYLPDGDG